MIFYGTILPPEQSYTPPTIINKNHNQTSETTLDENFKSGKCCVAITKCLGLLLVLNVILTTRCF